MTNINYVCLVCRRARRAGKFIRPSCPSCRTAMQPALGRVPARGDYIGWAQLTDTHNRYDRRRRAESYRGVTGLRWSLDRHRMGVKQ